MKLSKNYTNREESSIGYYLNEIGKYDLLNENEEIELFLEYTNPQTPLEKKKKIANEITEKNLRFVVSVAKEYQHSGLPLPDLINEGNIGLIKAIDKFDPERGFRFISYAVWWIRQSILKSLEKKTLIQKHGKYQQMFSDIKKIQTRLQQELHREPSEQEILDQLNPEYINMAKEALRQNDLGEKETSLNQKLDESQSTTELWEKISEESTAHPDSNIIQETTKKIIEDILTEELSPYDQELIKKYYNLSHKGTYKENTLESLAEEYNVNRERIRQRIRAAERKLRERKDLKD